MKCEICDDAIENGEEKDFNSRILCEDCYMDALSPLKRCDPWATFAAQSVPSTNAEDEGSQLSANQQKILDAIAETKGIELTDLSERVGLKNADLERELIPLKYMAKFRIERKDSKPWFYPA